MDNTNKGFASPTSIKPSSDSGGKNENELPRKKQLGTKNFMNPTISAAIKASLPKKKILGERNQTLETLEQQTSSFGSKSIKSLVIDSDIDDDDDDNTCLQQPYDPVKNYLSPRPKFLRYNPNRRRRILNLQENDQDRVKIGAFFDAGSGISIPSVPSDSFSEQESVGEARDVNNEKAEDEDIEESEGEGEDEDEDDEECEDEDDDEEEMVEFGEDRCCSLKGVFKFLFVVIAAILTTHAICSMNSPSPSQTLESVWGINGLNFTEVGYGPIIREPDFLVESLKEDYVVQTETIEEFVEMQNAKTDDYVVVHQDEAENVIQEVEIKESEVMETDYVETETVDDFNQDGLIEEDVADADANENNPQLTDEAELDIANEMEDEAEKELDDVKTNDVLIKFTSFDLTVAIVIGHMLLLMSLGAIYGSRSKKVEKEEFKDLEPSTNPQCAKEEEQFVVTNEASLLAPPLQNDISHVHIPSVELLGEFVFGEEITSNISTQSSHMEMSTGDSHTVKKQRRKNAQVVAVTPSPVRRSSRLKTRSSVMSP